jgi:hypothetical protein
MGEQVKIAPYSREAIETSSLLTIIRNTTSYQTIEFRSLTAIRREVATNYHSISSGRAQELLDGYLSNNKGIVQKTVIMDHKGFPRYVGYRVNEKKLHDLEEEIKRLDGEI